MLSYHNQGSCGIANIPCVPWPLCLTISWNHSCSLTVAFSIYDIDQDGFISNGELFQVLKTMVGNNLTDKQLQEIVDKTILYADKDGDGKISFKEFCDVSSSLFFS